jgi:TPR repeat protein
VFEMEGVCMRPLLRRTPRGIVALPGTAVLLPFTMLRIGSVVMRGDDAEVSLSCVARSYWSAWRGSRLPCASVADPVERLYQRGKRVHWFPEWQMPEAAEELRATAGFGHAAAMVSLAHFCGKCGEYTGAAEWLGKAAQSRHAGAMNILGMFFSQGRGVELSLRAATMWLEKAAHLGISWSMRSLGTLMFSGDLGPVDARAGRLWFEKAVEAGDLFSLCLIGDKLRRTGVKADGAASVQWYRKGAELGEPASMGMLAACCFKRRLCPYGPDEGSVMGPQGRGAWECKWDVHVGAGLRARMGRTSECAAVPRLVREGG